MECRAFYVALTRAKEKFVFLADRNRRSKFPREIHAENVAQEREAMRCRKCEADMRFIKNVTSKFSGLSQLFSCENYKYGCGYTAFVTQEVGKG